MAVETEKGELRVQRLDAVRRVRAEPDTDRSGAQGIKERDRFRVEVRAVPPGLLFDAKRLVENVMIEMQSSSS